MDIEWSESPNYRKGRNGRKPIAIVNHITAGAFPGCLTWMQNPVAQASSHYLITKTGRIINLVKDEDTAWHAGAVNKPSWPLYDGTNPNYYTIGIEHEGQPGDPLTDAQYAATLWLHRQLVAKWGIPVDRDHIIGHYRIDSVNRPNCPGSGFPWDRLLNDLKGEKAMPEEWEVKAIHDAEEAGVIQTGAHKPEEPANKAFVVAVAMKVFREVQKLSVENRTYRQGVSDAATTLMGLLK